MQVDQITENAGGLGIPVLEETGAVDENIALFKLITSLLIIVMVIILSAIATRLRGGGFALAMGQISTMMWIAALTSWITISLLDVTLGAFFAPT